MHAHAGAIEYLTLLSKQNSVIEKSMVCYRVWHVLAAVRESEMVTAIHTKSPDQSRKAHHLYQTQTRVEFMLTLSAKNKKLQKLVAQGYEAGIGMNLIENMEILEPDCVHGVNALLSAPEHRSLANKASAKASTYVDEVFERWADDGTETPDKP